MAKAALEIKGVVQTIKVFRDFGKEGDRVFKDVTKIAALELEAEAKRNAPVDTGKMKQAIKAEEFSPLKWVVTAYEIYSAFVEFGTRFMSAQPFLYPAWKKVSKTYVKDLASALRRLTKKYNK